MVRRGWILATIVCLVAGFAIAPTPKRPPQGAESPQAEPPKEIARYLNPQRLVRIAPGRTILGDFWEATATQACAETLSVEMFLTD